MGLSGYNIVFSNRKKNTHFLVSIETSASPTDPEKT